MFARKRKYDLGDGYGVSPVSGSTGLLTFYYLKLHSRGVTPLYVDRRLADPEAAPSFRRGEQHSHLRHPDGTTLR
jgi:hypothetical protein